MKSQKATKLVVCLHNRANSIHMIWMKALEELGLFYETIINLMFQN